MRNFWSAPPLTIADLTARDAFARDASARLREQTQVQRDVDGDRRHERRLVALGAAIRLAITENGDVFGDGDPVAEMAEAACNVRERACSR